MFLCTAINNKQGLSKQLYHMQLKQFVGNTISYIFSSNKTETTDNTRVARKIDICFLF